MTIIHLLSRSENKCLLNCPTVQPDVCKHLVSSEPTVKKDVQFIILCRKEKHQLLIKASKTIHTLFTVFHSVSCNQQHFNRALVDESLSKHLDKLKTMHSKKETVSPTS